MIPARDDRFWNRLLKSIEEGQVVPVIGPQLLVWGEADNPQSLQRLVAEEMLQLRGVDPLRFHFRVIANCPTLLPSSNVTSICKTSMATFLTRWIMSSRK